MSPRVFDGWAPREVHEHFDPDGTLTGRTVIQREPLWDDSDRERALELEAFEAGLCQCGCGQPLAEALDRNRAFDVQKVVCYAKRAADREQRKAGEAAKQSKLADGWDDGLRWIIVDSFVTGSDDDPNARRKGVTDG